MFKDLPDECSLLFWGGQVDTCAHVTQDISGTAEIKNRWWCGGFGKQILQAVALVRVHGFIQIP